MADNARSPDICPWDPGEVCKAANGACLPPRKRLLAGLKQNGWLSSTPPYFQGVSGASCAPEELKLEVDLRETKHECTEDAFYSESPTCKQGECNAVEELVSVSVKSKRAIKRRKSLSVLADCRNSVKNLQPELLKSCTGGQIQEKVRSNKVSIESLLTSSGEKASVHYYKEMLDAARAAAAKAAKAAAEAKSIALEKAAAAAKAAAVARVALEAVALTAENEVLECQPSRYGWTSCEQNRIGKELEGERGSGTKVLPLPHLLLTEGVDEPFEKKSGNKRTLNGSVSFIESQDDEETQAGQSPAFAFHSDGVLDRIKEDKGIQSGQNSFVALTTSVDNTPFDKHEEAQQTHKICTVACPMPPPFDDEKLARQLHRAMNSSPRISRSRACLEYCRKSETSPFSTDGCTQIRYPQVGGCSSSREKKQLHKDKLRVSRSSTGKADIKIKSMTAINETLSMLQKATIVQSRVLGSTGSYFATSDEYRDTFGHKEDDSIPDDSAFVSLTNCNEEGSTLTGNCDADGSHKVCLKAKGITGHFHSYAGDFGTVGRDDDFTASKSSRILRKFNSRRRRRTTGSILASTQSGNGNRANELLSTCADSQSDTPSNVASEQTGSYLGASYDDDYKGSDENQDGIMVSGPGSTAGVDVNETPAIKTIQENSSCSKSGRAACRFSHRSLRGERLKRGQKILGVLANGLSEGNQNFGKSLSSFLPSPTAL